MFSHFVHRPTSASLRYSSLHFQGNKTELYYFIPHITTNNTDVDSSDVVHMLIKASHTQMGGVQKNVRLGTAKGTHQ